MMDVLINYVAPIVAFILFLVALRWYLNRAARQLDAQIQRDLEAVGTTGGDLSRPIPDYAAVFEGMEHVRQMPVGPGERFETEADKDAFLSGMWDFVERMGADRSDE